MEHPTYEVKLNSEFVDDVKYNELLEQDKLILQQYKGEEDDVYVVLNGNQVKISLRDVKMIIDLFHDNYIVKIEKGEL